MKWDRRAKREGRPWRVFCASLADVFEPWDGALVATNGVQMWKRDDGSWTTSDHYPDTVALTLDDARARAFAVMTATTNLTWLVLTKRPENIARMVPPAWMEPGVWPAHVWAGTTVENQEYADRRIPELLKVPSPVRWLSVEPQLGPVDLDLDRYESPGYFEYRKNLLHWVITGGESGAGARPFDLAWARSLRDQCRAAGVAFFCKQLGKMPVRADGHDRYYTTDTARAWEPAEAGRIRLKLLDKKGGNPTEWPEDLRVREFPA